ncbi:MAG: NTP transferase domain-containing protein [Gaiellaceae bacterium]
MKAVILLAGLGSRLAELTVSTPKSLLPIGDSNTLEQMVRKLSKHGVRSMVIVGGHRQEAIEQYLTRTFPLVEITILRNPDYRTTNTAYSLLLAREQLDDQTFIKLDGDIIFDEEILARLIAADDGWSYACVDHAAVNEEVIKVSSDAEGNISRIGNDVPVTSAAGESIGIERIDERSCAALFSTLEAMMEDPDNHQRYYEVAYDALVQAGEPFKALDITGLPWVEIDTPEDYELAQRLFG